MNQIRTGEKDEATPFDDDEEFDLDNSDDLNRFINKYESLLSTSKERQTPNKEDDDIGGGVDPSSSSSSTGLKDQEGETNENSWQRLYY